MSTQSVIKTWRDQISLINRFISLEMIDQIDRLLIQRKHFLTNLESVDHQVKSTLNDSHDHDDHLDFSKRDILDRIDDDRERHKRLRERIWVLPIPPLSSFSPKPLLTSHHHHPSSTYTFHRSATLLHTSLLNTPPTTTDLPTQQQPQPHTDSDATISLECDQLIAANVEDTGDQGLEESDWQTIRFENNRCFGLDQPS